MKAITIWQPWASLIAVGAKGFETRSWKTSYRGPIAIHAAAKDPHTIMISLPCSEQRAIYKCLYMKLAVQSGVLKKLPLGCIIATAELAEIWRIVHYPGTNIDVAKHIPVGGELDVPKHHPDFHKTITPTDMEMLYGDWAPGRYAWQIENVKMLPEPIPCKGQQGLWKWEGKK